MKKIFFNETKIESSAETVEEFIREQKIDKLYLAVIVNDVIISKDEWKITYLKDSDCVDMYTPVGGG